MESDIKSTLALVLLLAAPLAAQTTLDQYGGVSNTTCTNPNGTKYFGKTTMGDSLVLCDPAGHPYFGRGFYVFSFTGLGNDETSEDYQYYVTAKYGSPPNYNWDAAAVARMKSWDFNLVGPFSTTYALPMWGWIPSGTNPNKLPFVYLEEGCSYSWNNTGNWGSAPVKDILGARSSFWTGYASSGVTDYEDPAWTNFINGEAGPSGDSALRAIVNASGSDKSYLVAISYCNGDYTHGFGAGPDFDTQPTLGNNDFRLSWLITLSSPVEWASTRQNQIYTDPTVYSKKTLYTQVTGEYASISTLNTAWGSTYTTFTTSGTCFGTSMPSWLCPSPQPAETYGTGTGSKTAFTHTLTHTTVSANSVGIFVAGTLVGGDNGSGTIYGPNLSGNINYTSGVSSLTLSSAPASGAAITVQYIANGWGIGTGLMDEDGRTSHQAWTGANPVCIDGVGTPAACNSWGSASYASSGMVSDMNTLDKTIAGHFASVTKNAITTNFPGALYAGITTWPTWMTPPNRWVIEGMAPYVDIMQTGGAGQLTQAELDYIHTYTAAVSAPDMAISYGAYNTANADSPFAWPNSSCSHSGTTVTCILATPQDITTSWTIDTSCTDSTYNVTNVHPNSSSGSTLTYTASGTPSQSSTTCNVYFDDSLVGGYHTQAARASAVANAISALPNWSYTADGVHPYVMMLWWQWADVNREGLSWGVVDTRDNAYNGVETTTSVVTCSSPIQTYKCGGELRSGWGGDDGITPLLNANQSIDKSLASHNVPAAPTGVNVAPH